MPRRKFTPFLPTQTMKNIDSRTTLNERHIRISRSMFYSHSFMTLNSIALKLYMVMRFKFYEEEKEEKDFAFSKSLGIKTLQLSKNSEKTIRRGLQELIKKGFIEPTYISKGGGNKNKISNRYKFSNNWKTYN